MCSSDLQLRISIAEYDYIIKEFQRSEDRERSRKKQRSRQKSLKDKNAPIPGFVSEETIRRILSEVFKVKNKEGSTFLHVKIVLKFGNFY